MRQFISGWRELPSNYNLFASPQAGSLDKLNTLPMNTQTLLEEVHKILKPSDILQIDYFKKKSSQDYTTTESRSLILTHLQTPTKIWNQAILYFV